jgi:UDP-glucuronate decarboxylase
MVAGGAGFLGSHLCQHLLAEGHNVICVDNFYTGSMDNIRSLTGSGSFTWMEHDIIQPLHVKVDQIYNLACPASPIHYQRDPIRTLKTSVYGAVNLLELARKHNARILMASTSEVYGDPIQHPQAESYWGHVNPIGPRACYDEGKRCAETLYFDYRRVYDLKIKIARIFNTYGPRMHPLDGRVVSNFIVQALKGEPLTIHGEGLQTRSFCYVQDLIEALIRLMNSADSIIGPINFGNPAEITVIELAEIVLRLTGSASSILYKNLPQDDPIRRRPDIKLAETLLNWKPAVDLHTGLKQTIAYFETVLRREHNDSYRKISRKSLTPSVVGSRQTQISDAI